MGSGMGSAARKDEKAKKSTLPEQKSSVHTREYEEDQESERERGVWMIPGLLSQQLADHKVITKVGKQDKFL